MHLLFLSAWWGERENAPTDGSADPSKVERVIESALNRACIAAKVRVGAYVSGLNALIYTADADKAYEQLEPEFRALTVCANSRVLLRYGPAGAEEVQLELGAG